MLYLYTGTDREKTRTAMDASVTSAKGGFASDGKKARVVRITDANTLADLQAVLQGAGMFRESRVIVFHGVLANEEMRALVMSSLPALKESSENFFILEEKPDADTRRRIEKYVEKSERYDAAGKKRDGSVFGMANSLVRRDKRALWVQYQGELAKGTAPEAIHGVLFWGAKNMFLSAKTDPERSRGARLLGSLAELPHESRRRGEELEYALERFVLSGV